jgi:hypothetical protein
MIGIWTPGSPGFDIGDLGVYAGIITAVVAAATVIYRLTLRPVVQRMKAYLDWNDRFRTEWEGVPIDPDRPWEPHSPGVLERLNNLDGEFHDDGNGSLKSSVRRIERAVNQMSSQVTSALDKMDERITRLEESRRD